MVISEINFTGLRQGEKLYEELLISENALPTGHARIMRAEEEVLSWSNPAHDRGQKAAPTVLCGVRHRSIYRLTTIEMR